MATQSGKWDTFIKNLTIQVNGHTPDRHRLVKPNDISSPRILFYLLRIAERIGIHADTCDLSLQCQGESYSLKRAAALMDSLGVEGWSSMLPNPFCTSAPDDKVSRSWYSDSNLTAEDFEEDCRLYANLIDDHRTRSRSMLSQFLKPYDDSLASCPQLSDKLYSSCFRPYFHSECDAPGTRPLSLVGSDNIVVYDKKLVIKQEDSTAAFWRSPGGNIIGLVNLAGRDSELHSTKFRMSIQHEAKRITNQHIVRRSPQNPLLTPSSQSAWRLEAIFGHLSGVSLKTSKSLCQSLQRWLWLNQQVKSVLAPKEN